MESETNDLLKQILEELKGIRENLGKEHKTKLPRWASAYVEDLYRDHYPRKEGKAEGIKKALSQCKTEEDLHLLKRAIIRFSEHHKRQETEPKFIPHFSTFMTSAWRDWLDPQTGEESAAPKSQRKFLNL